MSGSMQEEERLFIDVALQHYKKHGRHILSWRKKITPYRVLVSEVMLQQTQVSRVLPKFDTWMKQYPTLSALGRSTLHDVLILWQGLGYQRRAKALLAIGKQTKRLPRTFDGLCALPGVGIYTASAICAFAYDSFAHPLLETNIRTALIEYFHKKEEEVSDEVLYKDLFRLEGYAKVQTLGARYWYYALMDFGAHLKASKVSHNRKSAHHHTQTPYEGSLRKLRAGVLFAITHSQTLPDDIRVPHVLNLLTEEGFLVHKNTTYHLAD